ncbi:MAG: phosphomannose isomerase type II C-terminal cupin domain [Pelagibacteraceae bacterium]|jgi:mannose-6-phosphate isomerase-like protein (cupin superfamily)|nr:phosphomannose isomerase type II C-terminal cupin domain [Pelagibacteraceae bacterium]MDP6784342.1 phosphomannose isomerase type II C-terminal cupin domain [Alphaproteobacteria bacterium]MBO6468341.1 phosphomannose isomerase type II C-terminal cupin domain [Pelagibacteraceae bacterium]MBO6470343.1 phosphomannose isomerase type II C-terminal cupin domain [Pelagibacteraceae bacterium]MBO6471441.1 phosphomannose isomerase type II C-terminal cupin domain [Pelagibacteraceae bacterium]|tara:strand:- start:281 stop:625 length:345 start_codon:yes stop_codon:yes gene_type:complete
MKLFVDKPWGSYQIIDQGENFVVKKIVVKPYGKLSLQSHKHRSEHWIIVEGRAEVTINDNITTLEPNQNTYIPPETKHRLANNYDKNLILIEVWYGKNLDEEDITRYEDIYNRV